MKTLNRSAVLLRAAERGLVRLMISKIARDSRVSSETARRVLSGNLDGHSLETRRRVLYAVGFTNEEIDGLLAAAPESREQEASATL